MKIRIALYIATISIVFSCSNEFQTISKRKWELKYHDSLVTDTMELNVITTSLRKRQIKTLGFNNDGSFYYAYKRYPFYNRSDYLICGTDELELINGSAFYKIHGDTIALRFQGTEFSSPGCCTYNLNREFKIYHIDGKTIRLVKLNDLEDVK